MEVIAQGGFGDERAPELPGIEGVSLLIESGKRPPLGRPEGTRLSVGDIRDRDAVAAAVAGCDVVLHLAAIIHGSFRGLSEVMAVNAEGTRILVEEAEAAGCKRLVLVSSNSVAGVSTPLGRPFREDDPPLPYMTYGRSKRLAEEHVLQAAASGRLEGVVLRGCWYYGPHQADRQTRFFGMIREGRPVMFGDGHNLRSLTYVDHLVHALLLAATHPDVSGQVFWIADERPYETVHIYNAIADALGVPHPRPRKLPGIISKVCALADAVLQDLGLYWTEVHVAGEMAEDIACSVERARSELGYRPWMTLDEGMQRSVDWCRAQGLI